MKKTILIILFITAVNINAQIDNKIISNYHMNNVVVNPVTPPQLGGDNAIWTEDFSEYENIITNDIAGYGDWKWSDQSPGGQWTTNTTVIASETPENGFMMMEADFYNTGPQNGIAEDGTVGENAISAYFTIGPIDLSASETEELVLQFYSDYRICCYAAGSGNNDLNVYISTDGETFQDVDYIEGDVYETNVQSFSLSQIPLGNYAANVDGVYFRFEWIGTHYYWMIDDLSVIQRPAYDLQMKSSWIAMEDPANIEYYSIPLSQMPDEMLIGAEVYNYGYSDEVSMNLEGSITGEGIYSSISDVELMSDSTGYIETPYFDVSMLTVGNYNFMAEVSSGGDDNVLEDNTLSREFVISENSYALGGLYTSEEWMGTGWPGGDDTADGVKYANYFDIKESTTLSSILIDLDTSQHPTSLGTFQTEAGGEMIAYICDTTGIFDPLVETLDTDFGGVIWASDFYLVSDQDVSNGQIVIDVPEYALEPNAYYIVIELYSNGLNNDILIRDDTSVLQPWFASLVYYPSDQTWYSNPNSAAIELGLDGFENKIIENILTGIQCYPNPTQNSIEVTSSELISGSSSINIYNITGGCVKNYTFSNFGQSQILDLDNLLSGTYILELNNNDKTSKHKLIIE